MTEAVACPTAAELLAEIEGYCARTGTPEGFVGKVAFNHPGFVPLLRKRRSLRSESAAEIRAVMEQFPGGIDKAQAFHLAHTEAEQQAKRREKIHAAPFDRAEDGTLVRVTGEMLFSEVNDAAGRAGKPLHTFAAALFGPSPNWKLEQLRIAKLPTAATVFRVRHFIATGNIIPPRPRVSGNKAAEARRAEQSEDAAEILEDQRAEADVARVNRLPGETLADAVKREATERQQSLQRSLRAGGGVSEDKRFVSRKSGFINVSPALDPPEFESPSSVLRHAQRDWPEQYAKVKEIAEEIGVSLAEAWRQVIEKGVLCALEDLREESET